MIVRENIVDKQRLLTNLLKSEKCPDALVNRFNILLQDITSLIKHTNFSFERLEYLQDTVVGLINLDQNNIMKIFTLVSVLLMPPTLVASFYGMNVALPLGGWKWAWIGIAIFMLLLVAFVLYIFKKKKMF
jgi:magnesium transporter